MHQFHSVQEKLKKTREIIMSLNFELTGIKLVKARERESGAEHHILSHAYYTLIFSCTWCQHSHGTHLPCSEPCSCGNYKKLAVCGSENESIS